MTDETDAIMWMNKSIDDMTHDELLVAFRQLARLYKKNLDDGMRHLGVLRELRAGAPK